MHLLWALTQQTDGIGRAALEAAGADPEEVARRAEEAVRALPQVSGPGAAGHPTFVGPGFDALGAARREADSQNRTYLSTEHLMIGIALGKDPAAKLLAGVGAGPRALRDAVTRLHPGKDPMNQTDTQNPESTFQSLEKYGVDLTELAREGRLEDRKSTRLNSSHVAISYAVFCLKKKT